MLLGCALKRFKHYSDSEKNNLTQDEGAFHLLTCCCDLLQTEEGWQQLKLLDFNWEYSLFQLVLNAQVQCCVVRSRQRDVKREIEQTNMNRTGSGPDSGSC